MGLFNFFEKSNSYQPQPQTQLKFEQNEPATEQDAQKQKLRDSLKKTLESHNFNQAEIQEVYTIVDVAEQDIRNLKGKLLALKEMNGNPTIAIIKIKKEVEFIQQQMAADIKAKVRQIKLRKQKVKKARV